MAGVVRIDGCGSHLASFGLNPHQALLISGVYYFPKTKTTLRASFNRLFQPPQVTNLLAATLEMHGGLVTSANSTVAALAEIEARLGDSGPSRSAC
jgi:hypothetical protein